MDDIIKLNDSDKEILRISVEKLKACIASERQLKEDLDFQKQVTKDEIRLLTSKLPIDKKTVSTYLKHLIDEERLEQLENEIDVVTFFKDNLN